jgi:hypothetical protein
MIKSIISGVAFGIFIESVFMCTAANPLSSTANMRSIINNAPRLATMLSIFLGSLNGFSKLAEVRPYAELSAVFRPFDTSSSVNLGLSLSASSMNGINLPANIVLSVSKSLSLIATLPFLRSL